MSDGGESKHRGFKAEKAWCIQEFTRLKWLKESKRKRGNYETEESGKNWMLSSPEDEAATRKSRSEAGHGGNGEAMRRKGFQKEEVVHCVK